MPRVLVTGGAGFIGSHVVLLLLEKGHSVCVIDNSVNSIPVAPGQSKPESLLRVEKLAGKEVDFQAADVTEFTELRKVFKGYGPFDAVIHFAGLKSVGESVRSPLKYYWNNVGGGAALLQVMEEFGVKRIIFSSSSTVYGSPCYIPVDESHPIGNCASPYGSTKFMAEVMIRDVCRSDPKWAAIMLRYFNPIGTHPSGQIGDDPPGVPRNLIPYLGQVAVGRREYLNIFGNDYPTPDGTCVRGYIHVQDLAQGHMAALDKLMGGCYSGWKAYNLGMEVGHSVLQVKAAFEKASGKDIPFRFVTRRVGDVAATAADCHLAEEELGWKAVKSLKDMWLTVGDGSFRIQKAMHLLLQLKGLGTKLTEEPVLHFNSPINPFYYFY